VHRVQTQTDDVNRRSDRIRHSSQSSTPQSSDSQPWDNGGFMPLLQSDAIILKTYPLGEADRIVSFFTRDYGKVRGVANGARRMKNRFGASLEPLAHSRLMFFERENRDLVRIQSSELLDSPMS